MFLALGLLMLMLLALAHPSALAQTPPSENIKGLATAAGGTLPPDINTEFTFTTQAITPTFWTLPDPAYRIYIVQDGMVEMSYSYLQSAGLPVSTLDPRTFRMFYMGQEMAIQVEGEADGRFEAGDLIRFYGRSVDSLYFEEVLPRHQYTGRNVYWLTYGGATGKRMAFKDGAAAGPLATAHLKTNHQEKQSRYETRYPRYSSGALFNPNDDHWLWLKLQILGSTGVKSQKFDMAVSHLPADPQLNAALTATVSVHMVGGLNNKHGLRLKLGATTIFEDAASWRDYEPFTAVATISQTLLINGNNQLYVEAFNLNSTISEVYVDWVELRYFADYTADSGKLEFWGAANEAPTRYTISNLPANNITIYDVTDMHNVQRFDPNTLTIGASAPYTVSFGEGGAGQRYLAWTPTAALTPAQIEKADYLTSPYTPSAANPGPITMAAKLATDDLATASLAAPGDLLDTRNGADWIVITHRDFWSQTLPLAEWRARQYRVAMIDVQQIYDQFNGGMLSSESIRDFLAYAHANWQPPAPQFVLMAGGGTSDMRQYFSNSKKTYVPTMIYPADPILGETAADSRLVTFLNNDILPDMDIGRFPAFSASEVAIMVSKTISYESAPLRDEWNTNILLISDDLEGGGGDFYAFSDTLANGYSDANDPFGTKFLPYPYTPTKVYLGRTCDTNNPTVANECRADIADTINNQGALFVSYVGHAQTRNWAIEKLMDPTLAQSLTNRDKLAIFLGMACFEGFFHEPPTGSRSLSESYLLNPNGGAVASWSPTGFGVATGHDYLEQGLFLAVFQNGVKQLGTAMTAGKEHLYYTAPAHKYDDLIDTFNLLGDPALHIQTYVARTAVQMAGLTATYGDNGIVVAWATVDEPDLLGFNVLRSASPGGPFGQINGDLIAGKASGTPAGARYEYVDAGAEAGVAYWYRLEIVNLDGTSVEYGLAAARTAQKTIPDLYSYCDEIERFLKLRAGMMSCLFGWKRDFGSTGTAGADAAASIRRRLSQPALAEFPYQPPISTGGVHGFMATHLDVMWLTH
ncbi:MAG: C25 family cysteine peptidase [Caldilineaceae bacterium]